MYIYTMYMTLPLHDASMLGSEGATEGGLRERGQDHTHLAPGGGGGGARLAGTTTAHTQLSIHTL